MITRGELRGRVLRFLNKTSSRPGFYGEEKINDAITEAMDDVASQMFIANEGWQSKIDFLNTAANQIKVDIPPHVVMVQDLRYLVGDVYVPMTYDDGNNRSQYNTAGSGATQWVGFYRIVDNAFYFDPPLTDGGSRFLMVEYQAFPKRLATDASFMEAHFHPAFQHYIKYRTCSILGASIEKQSRPWAREEDTWRERCMDLIPKRTLSSTQIKEYEGG